jgi:hypothetical protein
MFCPKCGVQNLDDAKFCRACGADIRLVPQALTGRVARAGDDEDEDAPESLSPQASVERGVRKLVFGVGYLIIFMITMFYFREFWWATFWFIFPAVSKISAGAGILARAAHESRQMRGGGMTQQLRANETSALPRVRLNEVAPANTAEIVAPPASVTEGTTRHLDAVESVEREEGSS